MVEIKKVDDEKKYYVTFDGEVINEFKITVRSIENKFQSTVQPLLNSYLSKYDDSAMKFKEILFKWTYYDLESTILSDIEEFFVEAIENIKDDISYIDIEKFANKKKKTRNSIFLESNHIRNLMILSYCLKFYSIFFSTTNNTNPELSKKVFRMLVKLTNTARSLEILYSLIEKKLSVFKHTDKTMWLFISLYHSKNYESIINETFNFILSVLLVIFEISQDRNLVTFLVVYIDQNIGWLLKDSYNSNMTLLSNLSEDESSNNSLENFINVGFKSDFIKLCSYENTLSLIEMITRKYMRKYGVKEQEFEYLVESLFITPLQKYFVLPVISKITNVEYSFLVSRDKKTIYYLQTFLYFIMLELFKTKFNITHLLTYGATKPIYENSNIKMKKTKDILEKKITYYGTKNKSIIVKLLVICSTIATRKSRLCNVLFPHMKNVIINPLYLDELIDFYQDFFLLNKKGKIVSQLQEKYIDEIQNLTT